MSTHAVETGDLPLVRFLDLLVLALALPVVLATGLPFLGWGGIAAAWLVQRAVQHLLTTRAAAADDPRTVAGLLTGSMIGRAWLIALTIFGVGLSDRRAGLTAAVIAIALFTVYFTTQLALRPFGPRGGRR